MHLHSTFSNHAVCLVGVTSNCVCFFNLYTCCTWLVYLQSRHQDFFQPQKFKLLKTLLIFANVGKSTIWVHLASQIFAIHVANSIVQTYMWRGLQKQGMWTLKFYYFFKLLWLITFIMMRYGHEIFNIYLTLNWLCNTNCDWACENRACGHMIFAIFLNS